MKAKIIFRNVGVTETTQPHTSRNRNFENLAFKFSEVNVKFRHVCLSVRLFAWNNSLSTGSIFMKSDIVGHF